MSSWFKLQIELFWLALSFFSRIPIPKNTPYSDERMNRSGRYFALVGALLGAICGGVYWIVASWFPVEIAVFVTMVVSLLLTGSFHEDGLTDMADGIGGGMSIERRLAIMKDSRIGTYGAVTLAMALIGKFSMLSYLGNAQKPALNPVATTNTSAFPVILFVFVMAYTVSRTFAASLIFDMPYVSEEKTSKSKPLAHRQTRSELFFLVLCAVVFSILLSPIVFLSIAGVLLLGRSMFKRWLMKRVGGFTGDCLGAAQQISELVIYLILVGFVHNDVSLIGGWL
ncbi:adenosylcobinamide-GDP ribazoletransferase [Vibrio sp. 10N.261.55.A7]|uniref:adenosylcobinamide-GDP ribazoletransferase n=1 Tax=Vibrio sp. 10N.261.55.A7 TaxID=1880851 RepID=UPI000C866FE8|nr:adenosylcobinamide-GDP ribazoletransferase [Vibrio sp. 10N.261.55.A7]PMJ89843.1 adenosylcobinamide-GDP ribazoletransferase [Vibrio sp. 10N.261.55.A7]